MSAWNETINGMTWGWTGVRGTWTGPEAEFSMERMKELGVSWVALALGALQDTAQSTEIHFRDEPTVTDDEVRAAIRRAKALGLKVCLKPVVNCADGTWRAHIGFFADEVPGEPSWAEWFASYGAFIAHYARIAEEEGCEMLCVGCEMVQADAREAQWRKLIADVRALYSGIVTYNCDKYQEDRLAWWDAVDVISSSGYYPVGEWEAQLDRIEAVVRKHGKPFFFMEAGCPSRVGSSLKPNDWSLPGAPSGEEQARYYEAMFSACRQRPWVQGFMLWDWPAKLYDAADAYGNDDYCMYGKPAEAIVRDYYLNEPLREDQAELAAERERWRSELEQELKSNILGFWIRHAQDDKHGGFVGEIRDDMTIVADADKGLVLNARILWTFASAYRIYGESVYLEMADRAYEALERFADPLHGGLFWMIDASGSPTQDKKQVYGQAFAIYALAEYYRATGADKALVRAEELYRLLEKHAYDPVRLGYVEALARDWTETADLSLSGKDLNERKSMNTHLHVLEAYTNLYRVWKPEGLRVKLAELIDVHLDKIVDKGTHHFRLFFDDEWVSKSGDVSYGHDIEGSWLLCEAADVLGDSLRTERVRREALEMARATLEQGVDQDGGVFNELHGDGRLDDSKDWWPQAEAMVGFLNACQLSGEQKYLDAAKASWAFIRGFIRDGEHGEWHWQVMRTGEPVPGHDKAGPWKCPYHNARACMEALERLERVL